MSKENGIIEQSWGNELVWANTEDYCAKILIFGVANSKTPMHFHKNTNKSFFVNSGSVKVYWIDTSTGRLINKTFNEGETWYTPALQPQQIIAITDNASLNQVSNGNDSDDNFLITEHNF